MNLGKGFSIPRDKGVVVQNADILVPITPEKPDLQRLSNVQSGVLQSNQIGEDKWGDLLGLYSGLLQNEASSHGQPHKSNTNSPVGVNRRELIGGVAPVENCSRDIAPVGAYNRLIQNFNSGLSNVEHNSREVGTLQRFRSLNHNGVTVGSGVQSLGEVAAAAPQKVNSLAELLCVKSGNHVPSSSYGAPNRRTSVVCDSTTIWPYSQVERNQAAYASVGAKLHQDHVLHINGDHGGYNLQQTPNGKHLVQQYNLNLPPISEAGESSTAAMSIPLGPVTPDQYKQSKSCQMNQVPQMLIDATSAQEKYMQNNAVLSPQSEILERQTSEMSANILDTSTAANLTSTQEKNNSDGENGGIDLNKTPQLKTPKRRKHRPKVVVEGKSKRTPKSAAAKSKTPNENPTPKRKYVRRNIVNTSTTPTDVVDVEGSDLRGAAKSSKRKLNFGMENVEANKRQGSELSYQTQINEGSMRPFNLNLDFPNAESSAELTGPSTSSVKEAHQSTYSKQMQAQTTYNLVQSTNTIPPQSSVSVATTVPPSKSHALNIIARSLYARNASVNQINDDRRHNQVHHHTSGSLGQLVVQANTSYPNLNGRRQSMAGIMPQRLENTVGVAGKEGFMRENTHTEMRRPHNITLMGSQVWSRGVSEMGQCSRFSSNSWQNGVDAGKKKNLEENIHGTSSGAPPGITSDADFLIQIANRRNKSFPAQNSTMQQNGGLTNSDSRGQGILRNPSDLSNKVTSDWYMNNPVFRQHASSQVQLTAEQMALKTSLDYANEQNTYSLTAISNWNLGSASQGDPKSFSIREIDNSPDRVAVKRRTAGQTSSKKILIVDRVPQQESNMSRSYGYSSKKVTGSQDKKNLFSIDHVTDLLKHMHINSKGKETVQEDQGALVPYRGGDGAIVPYEVKKRRPRPKVDLDPETNRLWNLLMYKEGGGSAETMDSNKQKWWEDERKIFRGRVDSFIARMHKVQGDRRFSKWKGSVVDSVIGVFLTQNVSDHLSSSAFMHLAAKFPLKSTTFRQPCCRSEGRSSVEHHNVRITYPDGTTYDQKIIREPAYNHSSVTSTESFESRRENVIKEMRTFSTNDHTRRTEEENISSQSSSGSFVFQASEDIRSSSGSNSEADDAWNFNKNLGYPSVPDQAEKIAAFQQHQLQSMERERWEASVPAFSGKESISSLASTEFVTTNRSVEQPHDSIGQSAESTVTALQSGRPEFYPSPANHAISNKHLEPQADSPDRSRNIASQQIIRHRQKQETFQQKSRSLTGSKRPVEACSKQPSDIRKRDGDKPLEPTEMGHVHSSGEPSIKISTIPNARKRKAEKEKAEPINWDTLREGVESKAGMRERRKEAMDSLDYEALRNADVREISDTIKERGMNNMLAERMKAFLNRVVSDHGSIDLEWLRDVQPDKAKDYLLSIRGLGLKSVECIRLLTLHHLAFPVDTNVGRIAVRLGWVPLQPLPESLQLHLLELYPVLESIQKYLWPRLCKLDQETLYELHYQMITFGKVFCTKRDPNCNACPLRAECRHFASAFASARLALPGPEERRVVSSSAPRSANMNSNMVIKPIPLLPPGDNIEIRPRLTRNCEPLIEEPTTPESHTEVSERDIEDAFYEDPDEIPVIKLNVEELTTNLQSFMQETMDMTESDMSKALVALSPAFASIPVPKLKNISRLRTEHQVYELPDSHPLLKGMDRREPDDPSPYLLAIWTPGETADSVQPPEGRCSSQEGGGLCNNQTCFSCNTTREAQAQTVRGTILVPCRTAMRGSFPLNGTYFQVNEVFADHESSLNPIDVPRSFIWNLPRRTVFFGTSVSTIFKGLSTADIQMCFWRGFVCVRGFDQKTRAPRPLRARLHLPASKIAKQNE